jgi:adenylate cyclase class IV
MGRNVEIKARLRDVERTRRAVEQLSGGPPMVMAQEDVFYHAPHGRLKLRRCGGGAGELIYYDRPDGAAPRPSDYVICPVADPDLLDEVLGRALGRRGTVRKTRQLSLVGRTRIHVDQVAGLGWFLELEVVLVPGETAEQGRAAARDLMQRLGVVSEDLVEVAYVDLLRPA